MKNSLTFHRGDSGIDAYGRGNSVRRLIISNAAATRESHFQLNGEKRDRRLNAGPPIEATETGSASERLATTFVCVKYNQVVQSKQIM